MTTLNSAISPTSAAFKANAAAMEKLVADLHGRMATAALGGDERSRCSTFRAPRVGGGGMKDRAYKPVLNCGLLFLYVCG